MPPTQPLSDPFLSLFDAHQGASGQSQLTPRTGAPAVVPDPDTGRPLKVASLEVSDRAVCPACTSLGSGGYVSFVSDLRLAFACPACRKMVWVAGA